MWELDPKEVFYLTTRDLPSVLFSNDCCLSSFVESMCEVDYVTFILHQRQDGTGVDPGAGDQPHVEQCSGFGTDSQVMFGTRNEDSSQIIVESDNEGLKDYLPTSIQREKEESALRPKKDSPC